MTKVLISLSGGLDSVTLAAMALRDGHDVTGLFIDRGQSNVERERAAVDHFRSQLSLRIVETKLRDWRTSWAGANVPDKDLPRNAMFVLAALPFSRSINASEILLGCNLDDTAVPDGSIAFIEAMNRLLAVTKQPELARAPFLDKRMDKAAVAKMALSLIGEEGVARTWSCWLGNSEPCQQCLACRSRDSALKQACKS